MKHAFYNSVIFKQLEQENLICSLIILNILPTSKKHLISLLYKPFSTIININGEMILDIVVQHQTLNFNKKNHKFTIASEYIIGHYRVRWFICQFKRYN